MDPGGVKTDGLGATHVGEEVVADVPGLIRRSADDIEGVAKHVGRRLATPELPFDDNRVEVVCQFEPVDLVALWPARPVGEQGGFQAGGTNGLERGDGVGEEVRVLAEGIPVVFGDLAGQGRVDTLSTEGFLDTDGASALKVEAPVTDDSFVFPELAALTTDRVAEAIDVYTELLTYRGENERPGSLHGADAIEQGVIEVEEYGAW